MTVDRLAAHFARFGVAATWTPADYTDGGTATVILDAPAQDVIGGVVQSVEYSVLYRATELVGMTYGDELVIDDVAYTVRNPAPLDDGRLMRATLSKVTV